MKFLRALLIVMLVAGFAVVVQPTAAQGSLSCQSYGSIVSGVYSAYTGQIGGADGPFESGMYVFDFSEVDGDTGATVRLVADPSGLTTLAGPISVPGTLTFEMPATGQPAGLGFYFNSGNEGAVRVSVSCSFAGCDALVNIPSQAVVGHFNENSELYWAPGEMVSPMQYIEMGNTYYIAGQDESGMYRKVLVSCTWAWVRAETVGPNYDEVWQGRPLPTDVVD